MLNDKNNREKHHEAHPSTAAEMFVLHEMRAYCSGNFFIVDFNDRIAHTFYILFSIKSICLILRIEKSASVHIQSFCR